MVFFFFSCTDSSMAAFTYLFDRVDCIYFSSRQISRLTQVHDSDSIVVLLLVVTEFQGSIWNMESFRGHPIVPKHRSIQLNFSISSELEYDVHITGTWLKVKCVCILSVPKYLGSK